MNKATIYVYGRSNAIDYYDVNNYEIDDNLVIADYGKHQLIFPLSSIMMIEVSKNEKR